LVDRLMAVAGNYLRPEFMRLTQLRTLPQVDPKFLLDQ